MLALEERPYKFSLLQSVLALLIGLSPIPCILFCLYYLKDAWITLLAFHACLCGMPLFFKWAFENTAVILNQAHNYFATEKVLKSQIKPAALAFVVTAVPCCAAGVAFYLLRPDWMLLLTV